MTLNLSQNFDAAHRISSHKGKCKNIHGHTWEVDIYVTFDLADDYDGSIIIDFGDMKAWINELDHKDLNEFFERPDVTAEFLAMYFGQRLKTYLHGSISENSGVSINGYQITVWESSTASATITERIKK